MEQSSVQWPKSILGLSLVRSHQLSHVMIAFLLGAFAFVLLLMTSRDIGLTWDEPTYLEASTAYINWFDGLIKDPQLALQEKDIDLAWTVNHEHPPFDKVWSGVFWVLSRPFFDDITAHRIGNMLLAGLLVALVYLIIAPEY